VLTRIGITDLSVYRYADTDEELQLDRFLGIDVPEMISREPVPPAAAGQPHRSAPRGAANAGHRTESGKPSVIG